MVYDGVRWFKMVHAGRLVDIRKSIHMSMHMCTAIIHMHKDVSVGLHVGMCTDQCKSMYIDMTSRNQYGQQSRGMGQCSNTPAWLTAFRIKHCVPIVH